MTCLLYPYRSIIYSDMKNHDIARYFTLFHKWKAYKHQFHKFYGVSMHLNPTRLFNIPIKINDLIAIKCLQKGVEIKSSQKGDYCKYCKWSASHILRKVQSQYIFNPCTKISREIKMKITISDRSNAYLMYSNYLIVKVFQSMVNVSIDMERIIIVLTFLAMNFMSQQISRKSLICLLSIFKVY